MKRIHHSQLCILLLLSLAMAGCGGGNNTSTTTAIRAYQINATSNTNSATIWRLNGNLAQNGRSVSGIMHITMPSCFSFSTDIPVTGSLSDAPDFPVELGLTLPSGQILNFSLSHPAVHPSLLDGTYSITGAGCAGPASGGRHRQHIGFDRHLARDFYLDWWNGLADEHGAHADRP
ncbi:MAG: hypothetical protein LAO20_08150 [Acidobacteriia bacterium]|nr:hypothetical protein [Terriglobia bacterium]